MIERNPTGTNGANVRGISQSDRSSVRVPMSAAAATAMSSDTATHVDAGFLSCFTRPITVSHFMKALNEALELMQRDG